MRRHKYYCFSFHTLDVSLVYNEDVGIILDGADGLEPMIATGLVDVKGSDICEGHIVNDKQSTEDGPQDFIAEVAYDETLAAFVLRHKHGQVLLGESTNRISLEIRGNVWQHAHLIT